MAVKTKTDTKKRRTKRPRLRKGFVEVDIRKLKYAPWNYKTDDEDKAAKLKANIDRNGQVENIIIRDLSNGTFEVINGNHRLTAFLACGIEKPMTFNMGPISEKAGQRVALETNETKFDNDPIKLGEIARGLMDEFTKEDLLDTLPYDEPEFDSYASLDGWGDPPGEGEDAPEEEGDYNSDYTGDGSVSLSKLLQSLGVGQCTAEESAIISEAVLRERMDLGLRISDKDNTPAFVSIMKKYIEVTDKEHKTAQDALAKGKTKARRAKRK